MWVYRSKGVIWRVVPTAMGNIVGEERDLDRREASFFCINRETGKILWDRRQFNEHWWIGIEAVHREMMFLHEFATPDLPIHKKIHAVNLANGALVWSNDDVEFNRARDNSVFASLSSPGKTELLELDYRTGRLLRTSTEATPQLLNRSEGQEYLDIALPRPMAEAASNEHGGYNALPPEFVVDAVEVLNHHHYSVVQAYESGQPGQRSTTRGKSLLKILDRRTGRLVYKDILDSDCAHPVPDPFFVMDDTLYFVKNRRELTALKINSQQ